MAKQTSTFQFRKKVGNAVGYTIKNSANTEKTGVRIYQPIVTNPKTDAQSAQRMKLMPLQVFYESFSDVLNHAFQGRKVGQMNRQRFMQLNMTSTSGEAPAVQKGERILVPLKAQVSSGSLTINTSLAKVGSQGLRTTSLKCESTGLDTLAETPLADFSGWMISRNLGLEDGMEIAFIFIVSSEDDVRAGVPLKFNIVLNTADNVTEVGDLMNGIDTYIKFGTNDDGYLLFTPIDQEVNPLLGAACIVSKKNASGWSNNNARFYPTEFGEELFYTNQLYLAALASYGPNGSTLSSDLFLQQADNATGATDPNAVVSTAAQAIVLTGDAADWTPSSANAIIATLRSGYSAVVVDSLGNIVDANGTVITATDPDAQEGVAIAVKPDMTTFSGMRTVVYGSF